MTKDEMTYEQPHGWMQQLVSETEGKKTIRYTFTKTRIGKNDIPIYFEEALEQPAQEPVLLNVKTHDDKTYKVEVSAPSWQGLSVEKIAEIVKNSMVNNELELVDFARAIEAKLKEKNHG